MEQWGAHHPNYSVISNPMHNVIYHTIWYGMYTLFFTVLYIVELRERNHYYSIKSY